MCEKQNNYVKSGRDSHPIKVFLLGSILRLTKILFMDGMLLLGVSKCRCRVSVEKMIIDLICIVLTICVKRRGQNSNTFSMFACSEYIHTNTSSSVKVNLTSSNLLLSSVFCFPVLFVLVAAFCLNSQNVWFLGSWMCQLVSQYCSLS